VLNKMLGYFLIATVVLIVIYLQSEMWSYPELTEREVFIKIFKGN